ncbi:hypothetical protein GCM10022254_62850 [Actinomadura meridiana]|uniref:Uncharacterized protein n=1 Tax=Actinomadura meridiana TaxID=559626 RepID=A0ABP8CJ17_9ACTN
MPAHRSVADSATLLLSDVKAVENATARLRALARRLRDDPTTPPWFVETVEAHITASATAASDLSEAASHLLILSVSAPR